MNIHSTTGNCFRTAAPVGIRQKIARRKPLELPGGLHLWRIVGKVLMWSVPLVLSLNLLCTSLNSSYRGSISTTGQMLVEEKKLNETLRQQRARLLSPVRVKIAAAEKLGLFEPASKQIKTM